MAISVLEKGDVVTYPGPQGMANKPEMRVLNRHINKYAQSGAIHIDYLFDEGILNGMIEEMRYSVEQKFDNVILISGREGSGKSSLAYHICKSYDPDFKMEEGYIYNYDEFLEALRNGEERGRTFWLDEASNIASRHDWMKSDNKSFIQILEMFRSKSYTLICCIPVEDRIDNYIRNFRARFKIRCKIKSWSDSEIPKRGYYELYRVLPQEYGNAYNELVGYGKFPPMPIAADRVYQAIKEDAQKRKLDELAEEKASKRHGDKEQGWKLRQAILALQESGVDCSTIAANLKMSEQTVYNYCTQARKEREDHV